MGHYIKTEEHVTLFVEDIGHGSPIIFLHGWPLNHKMFEYQMNELPKRGFRFIGVDLRGYGQSDRPWEGYDYDTMADDVKAVIYTLQLENAILAGFSMGGAIAIRYMARHEGADVDKLILLSAAAPAFTKRPGYPYGMRKQDIDDMIELFKADRPKTLADLGKQFFEKKVSPELRQWFLNLMLEASSYGTIHSGIALRDEDLRKELAAIKVPTLILHGRKDRIAPFDFAKELKRGIKQSELVPFANSGHGAFYEEKEKINSLIAQFSNS
ncbi:alpha/beta fold hydrolase [Bacillus subtilis]|uniref:Alpha/beta hydrolase n=1 Tax=Bacillus subtilis TaxID=1423 RepID=A0A8I1WEP8_BACIU|nr:alpha/beta hydrolase [Bacillus subtilis]MBO3793748.1 alpha/beta hydrolase [Bacillus subtilis]